jgi:serine/threonine protein kinase
MTAMKTSKDLNYVEFIRREAVILKTLAHPLVPHLWNHTAGAVGANRIAKIVVGIALAMRFVHSRGVIHRDLNPQNILLGWDWSVRIADFGRSISSEAPDGPVESWPPVDSRYLAPECYDGHFLPASDVFAFGLFLFEILTGRSAFRESLSLLQIAFMIAVENGRPVIPESVLPGVRELMEDCWAVEPDDRPTFEQIVDRLKEMNFKVMADVNSLKLASFMKIIELWEMLKENE